MARLDTKEHEPHQSQGKTKERSRYENGPYVTGCSDFGLGKPHGAGMSLVAASRASGFAATPADSGSGLIEGAGYSDTV